MDENNQEKKPNETPLPNPWTGIAPKMGKTKLSRGANAYHAFCLENQL